MFACSSLDSIGLDLLLNAPVLAFDVESTGLHARLDVPIGFSIASDPHVAYYAHIDNHYFRQLFSDPTRLYIAHNAKFDRTMLKTVGVEVNNVCDTMIAAHLCEEGMLGLSDLIVAKTGRTVRSFGSLGKPILDLSPSELLGYSGPHSRAAWILWHGYEDDRYHWPGYEYELRRNLLAKVFWELEMPLVPVLSDMELAGAAIDKDYLTELGAFFDSRILLLDQVLGALSGRKGLNFNSPDQVAELFYKELGIKPDWKKTKSGRPAVEGKYLESIKHTHAILPYYLKYKHFQKLKSTYVDSLLEKMVGGRIYGSFNQTGTRTSRLSSSGPNLQNIPQRTEVGRRVRRAFTAAPGHTLVKADADQIELKMMAIWSKDKALLDAFKSGRDVHLETALRVFKSADRRSDGKTLNFQIIYGGGESSRRGLFFQAYPGVLSWTDRIRSDVEVMGYVRTYMGRRRSLPEIRSSSQKIADHGHREAVSTMIQGSSSEVVKIAMRRVWEDTNNSGINLILQVHDEMVYEVPDGLVKDFIPHLKERARYDELELPITFTISYGKNWEQMTKWDGVQ